MRILRLALETLASSFKSKKSAGNVIMHNGREEILDMRQPGESYCSDCPDHEACHMGAPCSLVKRVDAEYRERKSREI